MPTFDTKSSKLLRDSQFWIFLKACVGAIELPVQPVKKSRERKQILAPDIGKIRDFTGPRPQSARRCAGTDKSIASN